MNSQRMADLGRLAEARKQADLARLAQAGARVDRLTAQRDAVEGALADMARQAAGSEDLPHLRAFDAHEILARTGLARIEAELALAQTHRTEMQAICARSFGRAQALETLAARLKEQKARARQRAATLG